VSLLFDERWRGEDLPLRRWKTEEDKRILSRNSNTRERLGDDNVNYLSERQ
jgi:hypothetical protein